MMIKKLIYKYKYVCSFVLISFAIVGYFAASIYLVAISTTSPNRILEAVTPTNVGLPYEEVAFESASVNKITLRGWWIPKEGSNKVLILIHIKHGTRAFGLGVSKPLWDNDYNVLLFDLRGHGLSDGEHYSYGQYEQYDVVGAVNFLKTKGFEASKIGVVGWSMGAASALMGMSQTTDIKAGVIDSSYGDLARTVQNRLGILNVFYPGVAFSSLLFDLKLETVKPEKAIQQLANRHVFLIHGDQDETVPIAEFYHLKVAGGQNVAASWVLTGIGHAAAYQSQPALYIEKIVAFFRQEGM